VEAVMRELFDLDHGLKWRINRMPIGSSDFADSYYSLDDHPGDYSMQQLGLDRDNQKLIPSVPHLV
jgi:glucosylceramidase